MFPAGEGLCVKLKCFQNQRKSIDSSGYAEAVRLRMLLKPMEFQCFPEAEISHIANMSIKPQEFQCFREAMPRRKIS